MFAKGDFYIQVIALTLNDNGIKKMLNFIIIIFAILVGISRTYVGVHYFSDVIPGWTATSVWMLGFACRTKYLIEWV
ncbi:MAG: phosphatase PAP2 family protein [Clostridia bacterium]|nr:phosphatase PAP2 family protein [Clostridia bacterium]